MIKFRPRLRALARRLGGTFSRSPSVVPLRASPAKIEFTEAYHYRLSVQRHPIYHSAPTQRTGKIAIDLPFERMGREALADVAVGRAEIGRYGWLAIADFVRTDIPARLGTVRSWDEARFAAFPLVCPLFDEETESLEERIEGGAQEREELSYTPDVPDPHPFEFHLFVSRDSAVPTIPRPANASPAYRLGAPNSASGKELAFHLLLNLALKRPRGLPEEACQARVEQFYIDWPVPVSTTQFDLESMAGGSVSIDGRYNRIIVRDVPITLIAAERGPLVGQVSFRLIAHQPAVLQGTRHLEGGLMLSVDGLLLSGVHAQYFGATGYPKSENPDGEPLISYRTHLHADFECWLAEFLQAAPLLLERRYSWFSTWNTSEAYREVTGCLQEYGFEIDQTMSYRGDDEGRWWAARTIAGSPLILDMRLVKSDEAVTLPGAGGVVSAGEDKRHTRAFDLSLHGYYRGEWIDVSGHIEQLEACLRRRLHLRQQG